MRLGNDGVRSAQERQIVLGTSRLARAIAGAAAAVAAAGGTVSVLRLVSGDASLYGLGPLFDLDGESNVPAWFSSVLLLIASFVLACIALARPPGPATGWAVLSVGFLFLSIDEGAQIHERIAQVALGHLTIFPRPTFHWVLFGAPAALAVGLAFLPFLRRLPRHIAAGFLLAGLTYVGASVGLEAVTGVLRGGGLQPGTPGYYALVFFEETGEMGAIVIFIGTLLRYWREEIGEITLRVR